MDLRIDPKTQSRRRRNNWLLLLALFILAAFMYAMIVVKVTHYGLPATP